MDYTFNEQQLMVRANLRSFFEKECPPTLVRETEEKKLDYSPELYQKLADIGCLELKIPTEYKGAGGSWIDMAIFYEEAGRAMLPCPHYSTALVGQMILAFADEFQKQEFLPRITSGELVLSLALAEPAAGSQLSSLTTSATFNDESYTVNGTKLFANYAHIADYVNVVTREKEGQLALVLVEKNAQGLTCTPLDTMSGERTCEVVLNNVGVSKNQLLGKCTEEELKGILDKMKIMSCAEMLGAAERALEMTVDYSKQRISLDRPIGTFQSLQYKMADMATAIEGIRWIVYKAAWMNDEGIPCAKESAIAQIQAGRVCSWVTTLATHMHGAVSLVRDHDLSLYFRKVKAAQLNLGSIDSLTETILQEVGV